MSSKLRRRDQSSGPSQRQLRVGETLRHVLSEILMRQDFFEPDFFKDKSNHLKSELHQVFCDLELESLSPWKKEDSGGSQVAEVGDELVQKDANYLKDSSLHRQCLSMLNKI